MISNDTLSSSFNDSLICHPFLLARGRKSQFGLCDDEVSATVIVAVVLFLHTSLLIGAFIGLGYKLYQLKRTHVQRMSKVNFLTLARNPALMVLGALFGYIFCFILDVRVLIGRKLFPCFIFTLAYHFSVPMLSSVIVLRLIRLIVLGWMSNAKVRVGKRQMLRESMEHVALTGNAVSENAMNELVQLQQPSTPSVTSDTSRSTTMTPSDIALVDIQNNSTSITYVKEHEKPQRSSNDDKELIYFKKDTYFQNFEKGKLIDLLKFSVSSKFIYLFFGIIGFIHLTIYLIIGGVDYNNFIHGIKNSSTNKKQAFVVDTFVFAAENGCGTGTYHTNMYITYLAVYVIVIFICSIGAFFMKRDIWFVKREIALSTTNWAFFALVYGVVNLFTDVTTLVDYFVPVAPSTVQIACMLDVVFTLILPLYYQTTEKKKELTTISTNISSPNVNQDSHIRKILTHSKWNSRFLQFSEKSFSSEDIMMWNAVEQFKKVSHSDQLRTELFLKICDTYLKIGSPLELNIPRKEFGVPEIMQLYHSLTSKTSSKEGITTTVATSTTTTNQNEIISCSIFDRVQSCCEHNMLDNYTRFELVYEKQLRDECIFQEHSCLNMK
ncbi:hypothetical protein C9374_012022 [Naegleria lovaniensis]|uniref:RGS domain-containing protein n=1 Tax=Naegleria lovaniensis TaxID=51637 RepID=A0AA88GFB9_NAELO|nr:uncharacterized protein C9374_012022 [Naegleria lovaniensis]KAG2373559.1 hypothetical protein C9374_012022 [Naegleria lovaniensis]